MTARPGSQKILISNALIYIFIWSLFFLKETLALEVLLMFLIDLGGKLAVVKS